jgi:hypothetical protein
MAFVYEINGQRVEFEKEPTQADIDEAAASLAPVSNATNQSIEQSAEIDKAIRTGAEALSVPVTAAAYGNPTGAAELGQVAKAAISPYASGVGQGLKSTADIYKTRPLLSSAVEGLGLATIGVPPIAVAQQGISALDKYQAVKQGLAAASQQLSQGAPQELLNAKGELVVKPETMQSYKAMQDTIRNTDPALSKKITDTFGLKTGGSGNNAVRSFLNSAEGQAKMAANPQFAQAAQAYLKTVPTYAEQAMKVVSPALKGTARVLGPVGNALAVYDAGQMARETELGSRLAQGQGQQAESAFRNMNIQYGNAMTPQEAQNVLANGSARDIAAFGGRDRLNMAVRVQAAKRIIGQ